MLVRFNQSLKLLAMLCLVLNLVPILKHHVLNLLNGRFEGAQCDFSLLMLPESLQFFIGLLVLKALKLHGKLELFLAEAVKGMHFPIEGGAVLLRPIVLPN